MTGLMLVERYKIEGELCWGGVVSKARNTLLQRNVAIKLLNTTSMGTAGKTRLLVKLIINVRLMGTTQPAIASACHRAVKDKE